MSQHSSPGKALRRLLIGAHAESLATHPWIWEHERWRELVFAILASIANLPGTTLRIASETLRDAGLLDVAELQRLLDRDGNLAATKPKARQILRVLEATGMDPADARRGLLVVCQAAHSFAKQFAGNPQAYLRQYGQQMLAEVGQYFRLDALSPEETVTAFTLWFQNVLNMPLSLRDGALTTFCRDSGVTSEALFQAADDADVNWALLDDLAELYLASRETRSGQSKGRLRGRQRTKTPSKR